MSIRDNELFLIDRILYIGESVETQTSYVESIECVIGHGSFIYEKDSICKDCALKGKHCDYTNNYISIK